MQRANQRARPADRLPQAQRPSITLKSNVSQHAYIRREKMFVMDCVRGARGGGRGVGGRSYRSKGRGMVTVVAAAVLVLAVVVIAVAAVAVVAVRSGGGGGT